MAARLTDKQKKKIVADYLELGSYNAAAKLNGVSNHTVKRVVLEVPEISEKVKQKKEENTADILSYMEGKVPRYTIGDTVYDRCGKPRRNEPPGNFYAQNFMSFRGEIFPALWYAV